MFAMFSLSEVERHAPPRRQKPIKGNEPTVLVLSHHRSMNAVQKGKRA